MKFDFSSLRSLCEDSVETGATPSLVVAVGHLGQRVFCEAFGNRQRSPDEVAGVSTTYDLASLTKPLATGTLAMLLVDEGTLDLDRPVCNDLDMVPCGGPHAWITPRHLLAHASGYPAHQDFYREVISNPQAPLSAIEFSSEGVLGRAANLELIGSPGSQAIYSDVGFILLGALIEALAGERLDALFDKRIAKPLGLDGLHFRRLSRAHPPAGKPAEPLTAVDVAATEDCPWRGRLLVHEVHDHNAWSMGGVAGHAGLFGTITDVTRLVGALIGAYTEAGGFVGQETIRQFWMPAGVPESAWRLAWDGPAPQGPSMAGARIGRNAVGHLGFTGCSIWIDPDTQSYVTMLANRIHPRAGENQAFRSLRPAVMDEALKACDYQANEAAAPESDAEPS